MKRVKKVISLLTAVAISISTLGMVMPAQVRGSCFSETDFPTFLEESTEENILLRDFSDLTVETSDEKEYCNATVWDKFSDNSVIITLKKEYSIINKKYAPEDFPGVDISAVEDLTYISGDPAEKEFLDTNSFRQILLLKLSSAGKQNVLDVIKILEKDVRIKSAAPDYIYEISSEEAITYEYPVTFESIKINDPYFSNQNYLKKTNVINAWEYEKGSFDVTVGVIDSGINFNHVELTNRVSRSLSWDLYNGGGKVNDDLTGHGTRIAGIIGAQPDNSAGISGMCHEITMAGFQLVNDGLMLSSGFYNAINRAIDNNIPIVTLSYELPFNNSDKSVLENYDGILTASAGNYSKDIDVINHYPSSYRLDNIITVAATDTEHDTLADFSNYGDEVVDIAAPGTYLYGINCMTDYNGNPMISTYSTGSGTSFAAPQAAGAAALLKSLYPSLTAAQIKAYILEGADIISALDGKVNGSRRLNVYKSMQKLITDKAAIDGKVVCGDFNGDFYDDYAAMIDWGDSHTQIYVWESTGSSFSEPKLYFDSDDYDSSQIGIRIAAGDFNGDEVDDIAVFTMDSSSSKLQMFLTNAVEEDGNYKFYFEQPQSWFNAAKNAYTASAISGRILAGDFTGDGIEDVACVYWHNSTRMAIHVFKTNSSGTGFINSTYSALFDSNSGTETYRQSLVLERVTSGDYNGDNIEDIAIMYQNGERGVKMRVFLSNGTGIIGNASQIWFTSTTEDIATYRVKAGIVSGDFNNDNKDDIAIVFDNFNNSSNITVYKSSGSSFTTETWFSGAQNEIIASKISSCIVSGDFNCDGKTDLATLFTPSVSSTIITFISYGNYYPAKPYTIWFSIPTRNYF